VDGGQRSLMTAEELVDMLSTADSTKVVNEVPKGVKCNVWFLVDNTYNVA